MNCSIEDDVPNNWDSIINTFISCVANAVEHYPVPEVYNIHASVRHGLLHIDYCGGDRMIDGFALFAREMSSTVCSSCGVNSTRHVFGSPKCDECS